MIKAEDSSTMYDFMGSDHEAPAIEQKAPLVREQNWQSSNNERFKRDLPQHVQDAMTVTQEDHSYYAFTRFSFKHPARDNFESAVNKEHKNRYGELEKGFDFKIEREKYIQLYRSMMQ